ncbi:MAG: zinc-dependent metalloprotease [Fimbriimonadales bacterium]|nr:zinc-dependent metalloprotease [Fimbriimonadales bacterium]
MAPNAMLSFTIAALTLIAPLVQDPPRTQPQQQRGPRPYEEVVTKDAATQDGIFKIHQVGDRWLWEIPSEELGKDFLLTVEVKQTPAGGYGGTSAGDRVVRWERRDDKILLRIINYSIRSESDGAIRIGVDAANVPPIAQVFDVQAYGPNQSAVIDMSRYFTSDPAEFSVRQTLGVGNLDSNRSFVDRMKAFQTNVNVQSTLTFTQGQAPTSPQGFGGRGASQPSNTAVVLYSMVRLPDEPMMGRLFDGRVGYFSVRFRDYGTDEHRAADRRFITRYRLEKKDPSAAVSEPVKPIVYYMSHEIPEKWRPYVKQGVEDWQVAFEQAGFKNAIVCVEAPDDPNWDPEDARFSVIRWAPTPTENAMGPHVNDPRSGEIISAHIIMWHNILNLLTKWYFAQASASDPQAQKLPFPDALMGELVRYVVAHEVGHTLGLQHNFKASSSYTIAQLRSKEFTEKYGNEASIMDYGRFNYVAQPGDGARLIPMIGPYDKFAIEWGYKPIAGATNPSDEKRELDEIAARQVNNPMLRFGGGTDDPSAQTEDLGDDPIEATRLGILNLERTMGFIIPATTKFGEDYSDLIEQHNNIWAQYRLMIGHVTTLVGGSVMINWHAGRGGAVYNPVPRERQKAAVQFIVEKCFNIPGGLVRQDVMDLIQPSGVAERVLQSQSSALSRLLQSSRLARMIEWESTLSVAVYPVAEMFSDLRSGIWTELRQSQPVVDMFRRNLQRAHILALTPKLEETGSHVRALSLQELQHLLGMINGAVPRVIDSATRAHLLDMARLIEESLTIR